MNWLIRLYPTAWRRRYGHELEQLVHDLRSSTSTLTIAADLVKGAVDAHVQQGIDMAPTDLRAIRRGALIAGAVWLALSTEVLLSNVVFPSRNDDDTIAVLLSYLCIFAAMFFAGFLAARGGAGRTAQALTGLVTGVLIGALTIGTFAVVDNVWLDIVAQQQTKIDGFAHSDAPSLREFINDGLIGTAVGLSVALGIIGTVLGLAGGLAGRRGEVARPTP
jgi:hypothetical protein